MSRWLTLLVNAGGSYNAYSLQERCLTTSRQISSLGQACAVVVAWLSTAWLSERVGSMHARMYYVCASLVQNAVVLYVEKCEKGFV